MNKQKLTIFAFLLILSIPACSSEQSGFNEICNIYTEAKNSSMGKEQLSEYIFDNVKARVNVKDAIQAHSAIFNLAPQDRYPIFKQSAEHSLKKEWDCLAMKELMQ
jgi:hypothetical protein